MRRSRAPSQQFPLVPKEDIGMLMFYVFFIIYFEKNIAIVRIIILI